MRLDRETTAARQRASWLAQGVVPLDPGLRAFGAQGYRETCRLIWVLPPWHDGRQPARRSGVVHRQLAGIGRHSAKGLMASNQNPACFQNRLDFFVTKQPVKPCRSLSPHAICLAPTQAAAEQRGDRQRRGKGPLILTAEKGEHRSAHERWCSLANDNARDVREPRRQNGQSRAFSRSRRAAGFLFRHTFLSPPKEKCERPIGLQAMLPRRSRRVKPAGVISMRLLAHQRAFRRPLETFGHRKLERNP